MRKVRITHKSTADQIIGLLGWMFITYLAAAVAAIASADAGTLYAELSLPVWAPPSWLFGPVWVVLYTMMGIAAWMVWRMVGHELRWRALALYLGHLVPNALWSWLFFGWRLGALSFADILLLFIAAAATLIAFWKIQAPAGTLLIPYICWVGYAMVLNYAIWQLNPGILG
ncbi:MAG: TspO/MBR family protein [Balneolaceae bacterium]|nr:TspO/MBR family protein [Balneolaceae bacterium]